MVRSPAKLARLLTPACYLAFIIEAAVFFRGVLFGGRVIPWDIQSFHLAHIYIYADALARGAFPLWDPFTYCGRPFQANIQTEALYPSIALMAWIGRDLFRLLEYNVILHTALAGMFAFRLGRVAGLGRAASFGLGSVYQMGAFFAIHAEHMGAITIAAWIPLAWASVIELSRAIRLRPALLLSFALAMSVFGGLSPLTAVEAASVVLLSVLLVLIERRPWQLPGAVIVAGAFAALLSFVQLAPTLQLAGRSIGQYRTAWLKSGGGVRPGALITMVWPNYWGAFQLSTYRLNTELTFSYFYCGLIALGLALAIAAISSKTRRHLVFTLLAVAACLAMLGDSTPIGRAGMSLLPAAIRGALHPEYTMPVFLLAFAVLAGFGVERFGRSPRSRWILAAILCLDPLCVNSGRIWNAMDPTAGPVMTRGAFEGYRDPIATLRKLTGSAVPPWRFDTLNGSMPWAMYAPVFAIPTANGNDPLALSRIIHARLAFTTGETWGAYYEPEQLSSPALAMMNVRYLVSRTKLASSAALKLAAEVPGFSIYENPAAFPRFWLSGAVTPVANENQAWRELGHVSLARSFAEGFPRTLSGPSDSPGQVRVLRYRPEDIELEVDATRDSFLASSEANYPGWKASIDGASVPIYYTNVAFRGLAIPSGRHRVAMRFSPSLFYRSAALSGAAWLIWLALWVFARRLEPPSQRHAEHP